MVREKRSSSDAPGKISATILDFVSPLLEDVDPEAGPAHLESILKIAFVVWNGVVLDTVHGGSRYVDEIRHLAAGDPGVYVLMQMLIARKREMFADDDRLIGRYEIYEKDGEWTLRAEARDPRT